MGVERRLEFIEFRLFWEEHVNRSDLMEAFGVSVNQASTDPNHYIGMAPDNMVYDKSARTYIRGAKFRPLFLKPDASRYLTQLRCESVPVLRDPDSVVQRLEASFSQLARNRLIESRYSEPYVHIRDVQESDAASHSRASCPL